MAKVKQEVIWQPQAGPQTRLVTCPVFEVFFGGARGGGKTDASIGDWLQHSNQYGVHAIGLFIRRTLTQLAEVIARTKYLFPKIGARYNEKKAEWVMPNGARLKFAYLERDADASNYQGHNYTRVYIEEAGDFPVVGVDVEAEPPELLFDLHDLPGDGEGGEFCCEVSDEVVYFHVTQA